MKKFNFNKKLLFALITAIIVIALITLSVKFRNEEEQSNPVISAINDTIGVIDKTISAPAKFLKSGVSMLNDLVNTYEENRQLKAKLDNYDEAMIAEKNQKQELKKLKEELKLHNTLTSFSKIHANVISRSPDAWQNILTIDRGSADGIEKDMSVMSQKGLIGRVIQVSAHTAKVELLTTSNKTTNHFPVHLLPNPKDSEAKERTVSGKLDHFDEKTQALVITNIPAKDEVKEKDIVQTSGFGGKSPAGLIVGKVIKVEEGTNGLSKIAYVQPLAEMYDISVVTVIQRGVEDGERETQ